MNCFSPVFYRNIFHGKWIFTEPVQNKDKRCSGSTYTNYFVQYIPQICKLKITNMSILYPHPAPKYPLPRQIPKVGRYGITEKNQIYGLVKAELRDNDGIFLA